ncbi:hypothetical protein HZS_739 [Henneguya salminicola]|nr:hypothetical protein HZS_739 [Henneguya salminicola]
MIGRTYLRSNNVTASKLLDIPYNKISSKTVKPYILMVVYWLKGLVVENSLYPRLKHIYKQLPPWVVEIIKRKNKKVTHPYHMLNPFLQDIYMHYVLNMYLPLV